VSAPVVGWTVVVPVKRARDGKTRLAPHAGEFRPDLARAFALDTIDAAVSALAVARVLVVTDDEEVAARAPDTVLVIPDPGGGLNAAFRRGAAEAAQRWGDAPTAALQGDLPALRPTELDRALGRAGAWPAAFVADADGVGTTLLTASTSSSLVPAFGGGSRIAHRSAGAVEIVDHDQDLAGLRRDVDTAASLDRAEHLGLGPHTRQVIAAMRRGAAGRG